MGGGVSVSEASIDQQAADEAARATRSKQAEPEGGGRGHLLRRTCGAARLPPVWNMWAITWLSI